ncbi:MAG: DUF192 domain-containing protein [Candidatus Nanoarchaeia archaeon]|nr:DUF192 domain-containing protein [Candidatus Nanoarchaeia archaeon]
MKIERVTLKSEGRKILLEAHVARRLWRAIGLMFSRREKAKILLFHFKKPSRMAIHSLFVFFPFIAAWTNADGKILEIKRVEPFSWYVCPKKEFASLVEIPLSRKYKRITDDIEKFK